MTIAGPVGTPVSVADSGFARRLMLTSAAWLEGVISRRRIRATQPRPALRSPARILAGTIFVVALMAGLMLFADPRTVNIESGLSAGAETVLETITNFGRSGWVLFPAGLAVVALAAGASSSHVTSTSRCVLAALAARFGFVFLAVGAPGLTVTIVKRLIGRARPYVPHSTPFEYLPFNWNPDFASLPSGHVTTACATAIAVGAIFPRARPLLWAFAGLIAITRVSLDAHYPSDVFAAALVGTLGAILVRNWFAARRIVFLVGQDRAVHALPSPSRRRVMKALGQACRRQQSV